jgi:hypothetical protein
MLQKLFGPMHKYQTLRFKMFGSKYILKYKKHIKFLPQIYDGDVQHNSYIEFIIKILSVFYISIHILSHAF